jgi:glutathione S-transferase
MATSAQKPKLIYFSGRGLAEVARLIFADKGVEYIDHRVSNDDDTEFDALKPSLPFGQLPVLEINGTYIAQSVAITRYLAKQYNLYGKNDIEQAIVDAIVDAVRDLRVAVDKETENEGKIQARRKWLALFEKILKNNNGGQGFLVGNDITFADFWIYHIFFNSISADPAVATEFPLLNGLYQRVGARPGVAHWVKIRPASEW